MAGAGRYPGQVVMAQPEQSSLRCLGGLPAPPEIAADLAVLPTLPLSVRGQIYRVLGPCLDEPVPGSVDAQIAQFCRELSVDPAALARAIKASRFFLRRAAMMDLGAADLAADLAKLDGGGEIRAALMPGYETARTVIRGEIARGVIADHGKLVERVSWRVEQVTASNRGQGLNLPLIALTFAYREGERVERVTLQLLPDAMLELQEMCRRLL
jgi:hypothetical protein